MTPESRNSPLLGKASLSTLVTVRILRVPVTTDKQITTDECMDCWIECSVFGSRAVMKGHMTDSEVSRRQPSLKSVVAQSPLRAVVLESSAERLVRQTSFGQVSHSGSCSWPRKE
jgi:hypothetical protein